MYIVLTTHVISSPQGRIQFGDIFAFNSLCKLLIHSGDTYISCVINRNDKSECYYEGIGTVGEIMSADDVMFYAKLENYRQFEKKVPLTLPDGKYAEHLGRENTGLNPITSPRPVRLLKNDAYDYILGAGGRQIPIAAPTIEDCSKLEDLLKNSIRSYFVGQTAASMFHIERVAHSLGKAISVSTSDATEIDFYFYKPSSVTQAAALSVLEVEKELQQTQFCLASEKHRREELESQIRNMKAQSEEDILYLKTALAQAEARYQDLLLQHQQIVAQLQEAQETYCQSENSLNSARAHISCLESQLDANAIQRNALQTAVDTATSRIAALELALADLEQQYDAETLLRKQVEIALFKLEEKLNQFEQARSLENESSSAQIAELEAQVESAESQLASLQQALDKATALADGLSTECANLAQRLQREVHCRIAAESTVVEQKEAHTRSEQILLAKIESQDADNTMLRRHLEDANAQQSTLQTALDESATRIKALTEECSNLVQQRDNEILARTQLEGELNSFRVQQKLLENTYTDATHQQALDISRMKRKIRALEQQNERLTQDLQSCEYRAQGVCRHCGNVFTGFLRKKCSSCGRPKDY